MRGSWPLLLGSALSLVSGGGAGPAAPDSVLRYEPCAAAIAAPDVACGALDVPENPKAPDARTIALHFVVLKAKHPSRRAIYWNPGGPGAGAIQFTPGIARGLFEKELAALRDDYDILLVDNRGTGHSNGLICDFHDAAPADWFRQIWPDEPLARCRRDLAARADLSMYTTLNAVDDLDRLRAALGYPKLVLDGGSYGTYVAFMYMRVHPERVEAALLDGVVPPGILTVPLEDAQGAELGVHNLFAECDADSACHARFPSLRQQFNDLVRRFDAGPIPVPLKNASAPVPLSKEVFADRLRQTLYSAASAAYVPFVIDRAAGGDLAPLGEMMDAGGAIFTIVPPAANLSYTCAEQVPFITDAEIRETSAGTYMGDTRVRAQQHACAIWNVRQAPPIAHEPVRSSIPVLMVSGTDDPASPAIFAERAMPYLPHGQRVVVTGASHVTATACTDALKVAFVRARSADQLKTETCDGAFKRPPFATSMDGFPSD